MIQKIFIISILFTIYIRCGKPKPNILITSIPPGANILAPEDKRVLGVTPFEDYKNESGNYNYILKLENYKDMEITINLNDKNNIQKKEIVLSDLRNVFIESEPSNALIHGLGRDENTPYRGILNPGIYDLTLSKEGYDTEKIKFEITTNEGDKYEKKIRLWDNKNVVIETDPQGASISGLLNGKETTTPFLGEVKPGIYNLIISKDGYMDSKVSFRIEGNKSRFEKKIKLLTEAEYIACKERSDTLVQDGLCKKIWSIEEGHMKWDEADEWCRINGMRLPTINELKTDVDQVKWVKWERAYVWTSNFGGDHVYYQFHWYLYDFDKPRIPESVADYNGHSFYNDGVSGVVCRIDSNK